MQFNMLQEDSRIAPGMHIGNFDRNLYTTRKFVSKVVEITPDLAREFLERAGTHALHSTTRINIFAAVMADDKFKLTHQGIAFNWDGRLVDGYTRLQAVIKSGKSIIVQVTFGLDPADHAAIDTGATRRGKHVLRVAGLSPKVADPTASAIRLYLRYTDSLKVNRLVPVAQFTPQVVLDFMIENEDFLTVAEAVLAAKQPWRDVMSPGVAITLVYMALKKRHALDVGMAFIKGIGSFAGQDERHPILALYKALNKDKSKGPRKPEDTLAKSVRAFNKWVRFGNMGVVHGIGSLSATQAEEDDLPDDLVNLPVILQYAPNHHRNVNKLT